jgi:hypothetical protein
VQKRKNMGELAPLFPLIGKTPEQALAWLKANPTKAPRHDWITLNSVRVVKEDGRPAAVHCDARFGRVNVGIDAQGKIVEVVEIG